MIKVYGIQSCKDCRALKINFDANNVQYEYHDFAQDIKALKEFLELRDNNPFFDKAKAKGLIGIPVIVKEDGNLTYDWEQYLPEGCTIVKEEQSCSIDGNC